MKDMTVGKPTTILIQFAIPVLLGNFLQLTYSLVDTRIIGSFLGDQALAAAGATTVISSLYTGFFTGAANGFAIITARFFGSKNHEGVRHSFAAALLLGLALASILVLVTLLFLTPIMHFLNVPDSLFQQSSSYIRIIVTGMLITVVYNVLLASARAVGDSITPLLTLMLSVGLNIAGDLLMVGLLGTDVWGAAAATVAAQLLTMCLCAVYLWRRYEFFRIGASPNQSNLAGSNAPDSVEIALNPGLVGRLGAYFPKGMVRNMLATGLSMGFMSSLIGIGSLVLQTSINSLGSSYIVAQSAARRISEVLMSIFNAFGNATATYSSQNYGAGRYDRIKEGLHVSYKITCGWCVVVLFLVYLFAPMMIRGITGSSDAVMIDAANRYLRIDTILYVLVAIIVVQRHCLQGIGDKITPLISSSMEMVGKIILTMTLVPILKYDGVILVEPIVWIVMVIPLTVKVHKWKKENCS